MSSTRVRGASRRDLMRLRRFFWRRGVCNRARCYFGFATSVRASESGSGRAREMRPTPSQPSCAFLSLSPRSSLLCGQGRNKGPQGAKEGLQVNPNEKKPRESIGVD